MVWRKNRRKVYDGGKCGQPYDASRRWVLPREYKIENNVEQKNEIWRRMRSRSSNVVGRPLHIDKSGIKKWDLAENYQARVFQQVRGLKLPETIPRYRYNCIDMILSIWVYLYHCIDTLLSIRCYRICVRLYGDGVRLFFVCAIYIKQPAIFVQIAKPKKNRYFCL